MDGDHRYWSDGCVDTPPVGEGPTLKIVSSLPLTGGDFVRSALQWQTPSGRLWTNMVLRPVVIGSSMCRWMMPVRHGVPGTRRLKQRMQRMQRAILPFSVSRHDNSGAAKITFRFPTRPARC